MANVNRSVWSLLYGAGMLFVFAGERLATTGSARAMFSLLGAAAVFAATVLRATAGSKDSDPDRAAVERWILLLYGVGIVALLFYGLSSDVSGKIFSAPLEKSSPKVATALAALWPALWLASALPLILVEIAAFSMVQAPRLDRGRLEDALLTGLGLSGALVFAFSAYFVASERDKKFDLSYFRTARPGEATRKIARTLDQPIEIALFYPSANEVREEVQGYFDDLGRESKMLQVQLYDQAMDPQKAKDFGVSANGTVVLRKQGRREQMSIGLELESARTQLRNLDKDVQKRLLQVAKPSRTVYFTNGHGERAFDPTADTDKRWTLKDMRELFQQQSYTVRTLSAAEGLGADVPNDAAAVFIVGPTAAFFPEEVAAVKRYLDKGGRLFIALDPDMTVDYKELLEPLGLVYNRVTLANDQIFARKSNQPSDKINIATGSYSSHPSVTTLGRLGMRAPMVLFGTGYFEETKTKPKDTTIDFNVRTHPATFNDLNLNFAFDTPAEIRKGWQVAAAVVRKKPGAKPTEETRALLIGDSDGVSDGVLGNPTVGNALFVVDGTKWLLGDEAITGETSSEADVPILHTNNQDKWWFYLTIFLMPLVVIGLGYLANSRRTTVARASTKPAGGAA